MDDKPKKYTSSYPQKSIIQITAGSTSQPLKKNKKISKSSRKSFIHDQIENISKSCLRKINAILKNSQDDGENTRYHSM